jgi:hypothetical protein
MDTKDGYRARLKAGGKAIEEATEASMKGIAVACESAGQRLQQAAQPLWASAQNAWAQLRMQFRK